VDIRKIKKLIELINETGVGEIEVKSGEESVRISRMPSTTGMAMMPIPTNPIQHHAAPTESATSKLSSKTSGEQVEGHAVKAPMVGTVYLSATPGAKPFVDIGKHVSVGDTLCLIEAMKMFNKIEADKSGVISARLVDNEQPVEFDQPMFIIDTDE
jgi:acetyl-CoA carboxylase biotin carboxyl carrier protein